MELASFEAEVEAELSFETVAEGDSAFVVAAEVAAPAMLELEKAVEVLSVAINSS